MRRIAILTAFVVGVAAACVPPPEPPTQPPAISSFVALGGPHVDPALVPLSWSITDADGDSLTCRLDSDGDGTWDHTIASCPPAGSRNIAVTAGTRTARLEVSDGTHTRTATAAYVVDPETIDESFDLVIRPSTPMDADLLAAFEWAASKWESAVVRGSTDMAVTLAPGQCSIGSAPFDGVVDDIVVDVSVQQIEGYAGLGGPCWFGPDDLPRYGSIQIDPGAIPSLREFGMLEEIALHELAHVLGFGTIWNFHRDFLTGDGTSDQRFVGPRAVAEYSMLGGSGGVPTGSVDGIGTGHWRSDLGVEIMTSIGDGSPLSRMTIASIADLGYHVNLDVADPYALPSASEARRTPLLPG